MSGGRDRWELARANCRGCCYVFFFQAEDGIRDLTVTGVQTCALPICEAGLDQDQRRVLRAIEDGESIGAVAEAAGLSAGALRGALGKLELIGLVRRDGLGRYERALAR